jgi:hypothetical protein
MLVHRCGEKRDPELDVIDNGESTGTNDSAHQLAVSLLVYEHCANLYVCMVNLMGSLVA